MKMVIGQVADRSKHASKARGAPQRSEPRGPRQKILLFSDPPSKIQTAAPPLPPLPGNPQICEAGNSLFGDPEPGNRGRARQKNIIF